jgi:hypothetical protein
MPTRKRHGSLYDPDPVRAMNVATHSVLRTIAAALAALAASTVLTACTPAAETEPAAGSEASPSQVGPPTGVVDPPRSPRNANYSIEARLDPASRTITASEIVSWRNVTNRPTDELQFHLYWNAWKNTRSTFMRERALRGRPPTRRPADFSTLDVTSIRLLQPGEQDSHRPGTPGAIADRTAGSQTETAGAGAIDLTDHKRFITPDDGNADDETVLAVRLPTAVGPGETATVEVKWTARVPRTFARTGTIGSYFFIAQWFPKLGVLEEDGWNTHQFHAGTEFFADYGVYDVRLTVPDGWIVAATGVERQRQEHPDGTTTHHYYQEDVHDFAWTTSPDYIEHTALVDTTSREPLGTPIRIRLLLQPEHRDQAGRHIAAAEVAVRSFTEWFGPYPYGHLTLVDPAYQSGAGGMEYPTLVTTGTSWLLPRAVTINTPEEVTIHEIGHQWWYGIVGTNEFEHAWMDEGFTTYATARAMSEGYPATYLENSYFDGTVPWVFRDIRLSRDTYWNRLAGYRLGAKSDLPSDPSYRYSSAGNVITYNKTALWLATLERWLGWPVMQEILSTFFGRWQFKHPGPQDFFDVASEVAGRDLSAFFDQVYRSSNVFDYGVQTLESAREDNRFRTAVIVRRYGEAIFPVDVRVTFDNGERVTERWNGEDRWKLFTYQRDARALSAEVDPDRVLLLDVNYTNNSRTLEAKAPEAAAKWALKWMHWLQEQLLTWALFV